MDMVRGDITNLYKTIIELEAKQIFDKENFTELDERTLTYLYDYNALTQTFAPTTGAEKKVVCIFDCLPVIMPSKYGFFYRNNAYFELENMLIETFLKNNISEVWVDMSQGLSIAAANAVIRMKKHGYDIMLNVAIPYKGHGNQIYGASKTIYDYILKKADLTVQVSDAVKNKESFKNCILYMLNRSNIMICANPKAKNNTFFIDYCKDKNVEVLEFSIPS